MTSRYYRKPSIEVNQPSDITFAFTMRLLNFLGTLEVWAKDDVINPQDGEPYAHKLEQRFRLVTRGN